MTVLLVFTVRVTGDDDLTDLKTFSSIGKESTSLDGYREAELLSHTGKGCLTHMWFGGAWPGYEKTRVRVYVDGEPTASIDMELGLGHGQGFADEAAPWGGDRMAGPASPAASTTRTAFLLANPSG